MGAGAPTGLCSSDCGACGASSQAGTSSAFWIDGGDAGTVDGAGALTCARFVAARLCGIAVAWSARAVGGGWGVESGAAADVASVTACGDSSPRVRVGGGR